MIKNNHVQLLHQQLQSLDYSFCEGASEATLKINKFLPVYFDNTAGGKVLGGSYGWINKKHANGAIHEPSTIAALAFVREQYMNRINVIFDVGALYGYFSLISKSMFSDATVFSFEMNPESYAALHNNIRANKHLGNPACRCVNTGLSDKTMLNKHVNINAFTLREESESVDDPEVNILSIDDFCAISGYQPDLIKIDVEGYQAKILPGAMNTIREVKPIIILEFDEKKTLKRFNLSNMEIVDPLFELGYKALWCRDHRGDDGQFEPLNKGDTSGRHEVNSLALFIP